MKDADAPLPQWMPGLWRIKLSDNGPVTIVTPREDEDADLTIRADSHRMLSLQHRESLTQRARAHVSRGLCRVKRVSNAASSVRIVRQSYDTAFHSGPMGRLQIFESIEAISTVSLTLTSLSSIAQVLRQFQDAQLDSDDVLFRRHDPRSFDEEDCIYLSDLNLPFRPN